MMDDLNQFLSQKGTIELICEIGTTGARFKHLEEALDISRDTFLRRLTRGQEMSIFTKELVETDHGTSHKYVLDDAGILVWAMFERTNTLEAYHSYKDSRRRFREESADAKELIAERYADLEAAVEIPDDMPRTLGQYVSDLEEEHR